MDKERERIQADLRGLLKGDVYCDDLFVQMYASDASIYEVRPLGVVRPRTTADVAACVQYAAENDFPLHARGAGTGLAGESVGAGLVIDFAHFMRRIISSDGETVRVQPGVTLAQLNRYLAPSGRCFGPDPANQAVTTMGSVAALDASGSRWLKYGSPRQHIDSVRAVLADGEIVSLGRHPVGVMPPPSGSRRLHRIARGVAELIERNSSVISEHAPKSLVNRCGYQLDGIVKDGQVDLAQLMVGSEGTLALLTEITVRSVPRPAHRGVVLLLFERLELAARAALEVTRFGAWSCDIMDRRLLRLACESDVRYELLIPASTEASLLVEVQGDDPGEIRDTLRQVIHQVQRRKKLAFDAKLALEADEVEFFWRLAEHVVPTLYRLKGSTRPLPFVEDIAIPPAELPRFFVTLQNVLKKHEVTASLFGHAGHGQLHVRPFLDLAEPSHVRQLHHLARELYEEVIAIGGTISGEHGVGLSRSWFMREQYGELYDVFQETKRLFDPHNTLNPGKVVTDLPQPVTHNLRPVTRAAMLTTTDDSADAVAANGHQLVTLQLNWNPEQMAHMARSCNGCGSCRTLSPSERMCPIFRIAPSEEASPRAKANLLRAILTGRLDANALNSDDMKHVSDLCVNCHQCRLECPARVDIPKLMIEWKAQYVTTNGLQPGDWVMTRLDLLAKWASRTSPMANWAIGNRQMRWLIEKLFGIAQGRKLPRVSRRSFLRRAARRRLTRPSRAQGRKVAYFVDLYANRFDAELADALIAVLEHNGVSVFVPPGQLQSAMPMVSLGSLDRARRVARRNVTLLADAIRQGYHVVATEPSATLCLTHEYRNLFEEGDEDVQLVAANTSDACSYVWKMHQAGKLELDLKPISSTIGYHEPCHARALGTGSAGENLLRLIPGLVVRRIDRGCSGMAGTFGLKRENYRSSLRAGWGLISALRHSTIQAGATECSACKIQMEQGTEKPTIHPLKLLAASYGLLPDASRLLSATGQELYVS